MVQTDNLMVLPAEDGRGRLSSVSFDGAPGNGELLVRMLYAPVNPADLLVLDGRYSFPAAHSSPVGAEGVGVVERCGDGVSDIQPGDLVLPLSRGNWSRFRMLPCSDVVIVPSGADPVAAATMRINPATAWLLLEAAGVGPGDCIVQNAAASHVAAWVRQIAVSRGIRVIDVVRPGSRNGPAAALADGPDLARNVGQVSGGWPVRAALDCVAGVGTGRLAACLALEGQIIVFGHLSGEPSTIPSTLLTGGGLTVRGFSLRPAENRMTPSARSEMFAALWAIAGETPLAPPVRGLYPLGQINEAVEAARAPGLGKVLLDLAR